MAGELDPQALQQLTVLRRKDIQKQRLGEYEEAVVTLKSKVRVAEGQAMRETVQDKVSFHTRILPEVCLAAEWHVTSALGCGRFALQLPAAATLVCCLSN